MTATGLLFILVCATSLRAQEALAEGNVASAIRRLEHAWVEGESRNDNRALDLVFDNALVYIEYGKVVTKGEYLFRVGSAGPQPPQIVMEAMIVRMFGGTAIVVGTYREKSIRERKTLLKRWRFIDTWVNKKGSWMLVAAASAPLSK
jgi:hypothetical protein